MQYEEYGEADYHVFACIHRCLIVGTVHEESSENTETEPGQCSKIDKAGKYAEHDTEYPYAGKTFAHLGGDGFEVNSLFHILFEQFSDLYFFYLTLRELHQFLLLMFTP